MQKTMQSKCAVFRTEKTLKEGVEEIRKTYNALESISVDLADDENAFEVYIEYLIVGASPEIQELSFILVRES